MEKREINENYGNLHNEIGLQFNWAPKTEPCVSSPILPIRRLLDINSGNNAVPTSTLLYRSSNTSSPLEDEKTSEISIDVEEENFRYPNHNSPSDQRNTNATSLSEFEYRNVTLWQFLLELLVTKREPEIIQWTDREGEFMLIHPEEVARLWGMRKNKNSKMNYDKLSRALRYYYQKNIIQKVQGQKFMYRFVNLPESGRRSSREAILSNHQHLNNNHNIQVVANTVDYPTPKLDKLQQVQTSITPNSTVFPTVYSCDGTSEKQRNQCTIFNKTTSAEDGGSFSHANLQNITTDTDTPSHMLFSFSNSFHENVRQSQEASPPRNSVSGDEPHRSPENRTGDSTANVDQVAKSPYSKHCPTCTCSERLRLENKNYESDCGVDKTAKLRRKFQEYLQSNESSVSLLQQFLEPLLNKLITSMELPSPTKSNDPGSPSPSDKKASAGSVSQQSQEASNTRPVWIDCPYHGDTTFTTADTKGNSHVAAKPASNSRILNYSTISTASSLHAANMEQLNIALLRQWHQNSQQHTADTTSQPGQVFPVRPSSSTSLVPPGTSGFPLNIQKLETKSLCVHPKRPAEERSSRLRVSKRLRSSSASGSSEIHDNMDNCDSSVGDYNSNVSLLALESLLQPEPATGGITTQVPNDAAQNALEEETIRSYQIGDIFQVPSSLTKNKQLSKNLSTSISALVNQLNLLQEIQKSRQTLTPISSSSVTQSLDKMVWMPVPLQLATDFLKKSDTAASKIKLESVTDGFDNSKLSTPI